MEHIEMKTNIPKTTVMLSTLIISMVLGTGHDSFASKTPMQDLLSTLPKDLQGEIGKHQEFLNELEGKMKGRYVKASDLTKDNIYSYEVFGDLGLILDRVDDETMQLIGKLTNLKVISLGYQSGMGFKITDNVLAYLKNLKNLESIVLYDANITDAGLMHLEDLKKLKFLNLTRTNITDAGLVHLKDLTNLKVIFLGYTRVSDAGLMHLKGLTNLKTIVRGLRFTKAGMDELRKSLPNVEFKDD
jgi:hypothetical protein